MSILQALVLGTVQGLTEFLPISSSGHLVLVPALLGWDVPSTTFDIMLHLGTLVAVVGYFWREIYELGAAFFQDGEFARARRKVTFLLALGTVPAVIVGVLFEKTFEEFFMDPTAVAGFLLVTGALLIGTGVLMETSEDVGRHKRRMDQMRPKEAVYIGLMQAMAIAPGISRSGATIAMGLFVGLKREDAARYSFLLSIPVIAGAAVFSLRHGFDAGGEGVGALLAGFVTAAVFGFLAVRFLLNFVRNHSLRVFAYYCWVMGVFVLVLHFLI